MQIASSSFFTARFFTADMRLGDVNQHYQEFAQFQQLEEAQAMVEIRKHVSCGQGNSSLHWRRAPHP